MKEEICKALKEKRPLLGDSSLKTYCSLLNSLFRKIGIESISQLPKYKKQIIEQLNNTESHQSRKTILSPLVILTDDDDYKQMITESTQRVNDKYRTQRVDIEKLKGMMTMDELKEHHRQTTVRALKSKTDGAYQDLMISLLFTGAEGDLPPRRLMDYTEMKTKNYNKTEDNWTDGRQMMFHKYKTVASKGPQVWPIPKELQKYVRKAISLSDSDYLLHTPVGKKYTTSSMSKKLKATYGVSVDGLRAIYLSNMYKGMPALDEMERVADMMGHSASTAMANYVKTDLQR